MKENGHSQGNGGSGMVKAVAKCCRDAKQVETGEHDQCAR